MLSRKKASQMLNIACLLDYSIIRLQSYSISSVDSGKTGVHLHFLIIGFLPALRIFDHNASSKLELNGELRLVWQAFPNMLYSRIWVPDSEEVNFKDSHVKVSVVFAVVLIVGSVQCHVVLFGYANG